MATSIGTNSNNTLNGTTSADTLIGQAGNDTLNGSGGNDRLNGGVGTDILNGGTGIDTADYSNVVINGTTYTGATAGVTVNLGLTSAQNTGGAGSDTLTSIENVIGTNFADTLLGNNANNVLSGLAGNDTLIGGGGNDRLIGGAGDDRLDGGTGIDTADYSTATAGVQAFLGRIFPQNTGGAGVDTFANLENLIGSNFADQLGGDQGNNVLSGLGGNDLISGSDGNDTLNGGDGADQLCGDYGNDTLAGGSGQDHLDGLEGNDRLDGGTGADVMYGGNGNDTYIVDHVDDVAAEAVGAVLFGGYDRVESSVTHTLGFGIEDLTLTGTAAINGTGNGQDNVLIGNAANNVLTGLGGGDVLNGGAGADRMIGGDGDDDYVVDQVGDVAVETRDDAAGGIDRVVSSVTHTLGFGIEDLTLTGTAAINGTGNGQANVLEGNAANNVLTGLGGDDFIDGGAGADRMIGGDGDDVYDVDHLGDVVVETRDDAAGGFDRVHSSVTNTLGVGIEELTLIGTAAINGTGNEQRNYVIGNAANNVLSGLDGNDLLYGFEGNDILNGGKDNDFLEGGLGADRLSGGAGSDAFFFDALTDSPSGTGRDTILDFDGRGLGIGDLINLGNIDANDLLSDNQAFTYIGSAAFSGAGQLRYAGGILQGSTDGDTAAEFEIELVGAPALTVVGEASDIIL